ncbi:MAG: hypothetical protein ACI85I_000133 [Arenicella sp.]|jgi:hypothetical protein
MHGCVNVDADFLSYFCFLEGREVGTKNDDKPFSFSKNTYIYFQSNLSIVSISAYRSKYEGKTKHLARLSDSQYKRFIKCLRQSKFVKGKIKNYFIKE